MSGFDTGEFDGGEFDDGDLGGYEFDFEDAGDDDLKPAEGSYGGSLDDGDPGGWTPAELNAHLARVAQEAVAPYLEQVRGDLYGAVRAEYEAEADERRTDEADALEERYAELQDDHLQDVVVAMTIEEAQAQAQAMGRPELAEALAREPAFLEGVFLRNRDALAEEIAKARGAQEGDAIVRAAEGPRFRLGEHRRQRAMAERAMAMRMALEDDGDAIVAAAQQGRYRT